MGASASIQTAVNTINNSIKSSLDMAAEVNSNAKCKIEIGTISFTRTNGCTITVSNNCSAKTDIMLESVQKAVVNFYNNMNVEQKQEAPMWFTAAFNASTTVSTFNNDFESVLKQKCLANAGVDNSITIQNVSISDCNAPPGDQMKFEFINSGTATGQCAMKALVDLTVAATNSLKSTQSQGLDWSKLIWPILIGVIILVIGYVLIQIVTKNKVSPQEQIALEKIKNPTYASRIEQLFSTVKNR